MKKYLILLVRILVGGLFIFSGLIKLNDPVGTAIKLHEYFEVFSEDIAGFFMIFVPYALFFSVFLSALEVIMGVAILINYKMKITAWVTMLLLVFFTFLTFYSAYFNKVTDCGCFGDAIKLTPWGSFTKDVILVALTSVIFYFRKELESGLSSMRANTLMGITTLLSLAIGLIAINHLPFKDFRAYAVGENIYENMQLPPDALPEISEIIYVVKDKTTGEQKEINDKEYMANWKNYEVISSGETRVIQKGDQAKIPGDFSIENKNGEKLTEQLFVGNKLLLIVHLFEKTNQEKIKEFNEIVKNAPAGVEIWALTNQVEELENFFAQNSINIKVYSNDGTILKTMVRSNPGAIYLEQGTIKAKWHFNDFDEITEGIK